MSGEEDEKAEKPVGGDLLSQGATPQVPLALTDLTTGFGKEPGVPPPRKPPTNFTSCSRIPFPTITQPHLATRTFWKGLA